MSRVRSVGLITLALLATACSSTPRSNEAAPIAAQLSVERFLQAANNRDVDAMGRIFGTADGPAMDTGSAFGCFFKKIGSWFGGDACQHRTDVELRMDAIASVIRHQNYTISRVEPVAGRVHPTRRVMVDMTIQGERVTAAPFIVVQSGNGNWLVEVVPLEHIMASR